MNFRLVTGIGAVALTGPESSGLAITWAIRRIEIVALDPGHPLPARAQRPAEAEFERRQHPRDEAAVGAEHQADPQTDDADAMLFGRHAPRFPRRRRVHG